MLRSADAELTRPTNSSICFGLLPAAAMTVGLRMSRGTRGVYADRRRRGTDPDATGRMRSLFLACALVCTAAVGDDFSWLVPLNDLGGAPYRWGYYGGLYENGSNVMAADHFAAGLAAAAKIQPLDPEGNPSPDGRVAFLAVGFGETARIMQSFMSILAG